MRYLALLLVLAGCSGSEAPEATAQGGKPVVFVVNYPLQYFAERIGGDAIEVQFPAPRDGDPALWKPDDAAIAAFQRADLILRNGADYAKWAERASLPPSKCVDTSAAFRDRYVELKEKVTHSHGPGGKHAHGGLAFTTWLDPTQAVQQARAIRDALVRLAPDRETDFGAGFAALEKDLLDLDARLAASVPREPLVASHPVFQYWARRYDVNLPSVHWEPGETPDEAAWSKLKAILRDHPAKWMIWEAEPLAETVAQLEALGVRSFVFDPCANVPRKGDFLSVMRGNAERLAAAAGS